MRRSPSVRGKCRQPPTVAASRAMPRPCRSAGSGFADRWPWSLLLNLVLRARQHQVERPAPEDRKHLWSPGELLARESEVAAQGFSEWLRHGDEAEPIG